MVKLPIRILISGMYKINFIYNADGEVTDKNTYQWDERNSGYILKETEKFTK